MTTCWLFGGLFLRTNHGCCLPLSADAYMANREWGSLMTMSPNAYMGGLKSDGLSLATILGHDYSRLTASVSHLLPQLGECMMVSYFLVTVCMCLCICVCFVTLLTVGVIVYCVRYMCVHMYVYIHITVDL